MPAAETYNVYIYSGDWVVSTLLETYRQKKSWWRERNDPKRDFTSRKKTTTELLDHQDAQTSSFTTWAQIPGVQWIRHSLHKCSCFPTGQHVCYWGWYNNVIITSGRLSGFFISPRKPKWKWTCDLFQIKQHLSNNRDVPNLCCSEFTVPANV